jgi:hypothetical protein
MNYDIKVFSNAFSKNNVHLLSQGDSLVLGLSAAAIQWKIEGLHIRESKWFRPGVEQWTNMATEALTTPGNC